MQELTSEARDDYKLISSVKAPQIPPPTSPNALKLLLGQYAAALFESEATYYPNDPELPHWLKKLAERVTSSVLNRVAQVEHAGTFRYVSLTYHNVQLPEMQKAINVALEPEVRKRFVVAIKEQVKESLVVGKPPKPQNGGQARKGFVEPILLKRGWSVFMWATEAEVAYNTAAGYMAGKKTYASTRVKLAKALGLDANQLP